MTASCRSSSSAASTWPADTSHGGLLVRVSGAGRAFVLMQSTLVQVLDQAAAHARLRVQPDSGLRDGPQDQGEGEAGAIGAWGKAARRVGWAMSSF
jgi:hypothetical protein